MMPIPEFTAAITHLSKHDKKLARVISKIGPLDFKPAKKRTPFAALTKAVIGQQLSGAAATTIFKRLSGLLPSGAVLEHGEVLEPVRNFMGGKVC